MNPVSLSISSVALYSSSEFSKVMRTAMGSFGYLISFGRLPIGLYGLFTASFLKEETAFGSIGACLLVPADFGGTLIFFEKIGLISLAANLAMPVAISYISAYLPLLLDSICVLNSDSKNLTIKRQAALNMANAISQIALATFIIIGYSHPGFIAPAILVAGTFGSLSFLYKQAVVKSELLKQRT